MVAHYYACWLRPAHPSQDVHEYDPILESWRAHDTTGAAPRTSFASTAVVDANTRAVTVYQIGGRNRYTSQAEVAVGTWTTDTSATGHASATGLAADEVECGPGTYSLGGAYNCTKCAPGRYQEVATTTTTNAHTH